MSLNEEPSKAAKFKGMISVVSGVNDDMEDSYIWGLYPYDENATLSDGEITTSLPSDQQGKADTFADDLLITMGVHSTSVSHSIMSAQVSASP